MVASTCPGHAKGVAAPALAPPKLENEDIFLPNGNVSHAPGLQRHIFSCARFDLFSRLTFLGWRAFLPYASSFCALKPPRNKRHALPDPRRRRKSKSSGQSQLTSSSRIALSRFPNIRKRFRRSFRYTRCQPCSAASRIAYVSAPTPQDLSWGASGYLTINWSGGFPGVPFESML